MDVKLKDSQDRYVGPTNTYRISGSHVAAAGVLPFLTLQGVAGKVGRIQRIRISGFTLTAVQYLRISLRKHSTAHTGGTPTGYTPVPMDSGDIAAGCVPFSWTAGPTGGGTAVGPMGEIQVLGQATVAAAVGVTTEADFDFRSMRAETPKLKAAAESVSVSFGAAPATAVTVSWEIEWTEDGN